MICNTLYPFCLCDLQYVKIDFQIKIDGGIHPHALCHHMCDQKCITRNV